MNRSAKFVAVLNPFAALRIFRIQFLFPKRCVEQLKSFFLIISTLLFGAEKLFSSCLNVVSSKQQK